MNSTQSSGMARTNIFITVLFGIFRKWQCWSSLMRIKVEERMVLDPDKIVRGRRPAPDVVSKQYFTHITTPYPAIPTDCGILMDDSKASQYTGVILSSPNLVPTRISVGWNVVSSGFAILIKVSSYTSAPSPVMYVLRPESLWIFVKDLRND